MRKTKFIMAILAVLVFAGSAISHENVEQATRVRVAQLVTPVAQVMSQPASDVAVTQFNQLLLSSNSQIEALGSAYIFGRSASQVEALGSAYIFGRSASQVEALGSAYIFGRSASQVEALGSAYIFGRSASQVEALGSAYIFGR
ncbi:MAG: hypothetical protein KIT50_02025 [Bacteroidetes bacterium]|nr:hypothetical protein [Bacteroidota bacterium]